MAVRGGSYMSSPTRRDERWEDRPVGQRRGVDDGDGGEDAEMTMKVQSVRPEHGSNR